MVDLNVNNLRIGEDGRVRFSGLGSGIDFESAVDGIIAAKRIPIDRLEAKIETNQAKIDDLLVTRDLVQAVQESLQGLYGAITFDQSGNIFASKQAFASSSRQDGGTASPPTNILGVSVTSKASAGSHSVEVLQTARAHRVGSGAFTSTSADLGTARGLGAGAVSGNIEIAGKSIAVLATDSLNDIKDRINNANSGDSPTGVSATVVSTSPSEHYLVLTVDATGKTLGTDIALNDPDGVLEDLGVLNGSGGYANQLQAARKAQVKADGLLDSTSQSSATQASSSAALGVAGTLTFNDGSGGLIGTINYQATDSLDDIANLIANDVTLQNAGFTASVSAVGGGFQLDVDRTSGFNISDSGSLVEGIGLAKNDLIIERDSNTISDLFTGVTLSLFQAEAGTTIEIDVERNLSQVKTGIVGFVDAYNALRQELNRQLNVDPDTGAASEDANLFGSRALKEIDRRMESIVGGGADGVDGAFSVLAQIGIDFVKNGELTDRTLRDTLQINEEELDEALLNNPDQVRKLFQFNFSSSDPRVVALGFSGATSYKDGGYTLDIDYDEVNGNIAGVTLDEGTGTANGQNVTINTGGASGLRLFYSGDTDLTGVKLDFSVGIGAKLFFDLDSLLDDTDGVIATEIDTLTDQNTVAEERTTAMLERLEREREFQLDKFVRMEAALASMNQLLEQVRQITDAMFQDR